MLVLGAANPTLQCLLMRGGLRDLTFMPSFSAANAKPSRSSSCAWHIRAPVANDGIPSSPNSNKRDSPRLKHKKRPLGFPCQISYLTAWSRGMSTPTEKSAVRQPGRSRTTASHG